MGVRINVEVTGNDAVVTVHGFLDGSLLDAAAEGLVGLGHDCLSIVVDLRDAVLASPADLSRLITALGDHAADENIALVCDRLPGRRLIRLTCGPAKVQVLSELPGSPDEPAVPEAV